MTRRAALAAVLAGVAAAPLPAAGDEAIGRRLATLRRLVEPATAGRGAPAEPAADSCGAGAWWRATEYGLRSRTDDAVRDASLRFAVDPRLVRSVIRHESGGDPDAVSPAGAMGLMQLMPATARRLGVACPFDPRENVLAGTRYLRRLRDRLGSWPRALAAYHAGPARVETGRVPEETRAYVERVLATWHSRRHSGTFLKSGGRGQSCQGCPS